MRRIRANALGNAFAYVRCTIFDVRFGKFGGYAADLAPGGARWQAGPAYVRGTMDDVRFMKFARLRRGVLVVMIFDAYKHGYQSIRAFDLLIDLPQMRLPCPHCRALRVQFCNQKEEIQKKMLDMLGF